MANFSGLASSWRYAKSRYYGADAALDAVAHSYPTLAQDPDIAAARSAIRNAERAIEARINELDQDEEE